MLHTRSSMADSKAATRSDGWAGHSGARSAALMGGSKAAYSVDGMAATTADGWAGNWDACSAAYLVGWKVA